MDTKGFEALQLVLAQSHANIVPRPKEGESIRFLSVVVRDSSFVAREILPHLVLNMLDSGGFIENPGEAPLPRDDMPVLRVLGITKHFITFEDLSAR